MKNNFVKLAGVLFIISAVAAGSLAWLNDVTKEKIAMNDLSASMSPEVVQAVAPGAKTFMPVEDTALVETVKAENAKVVDLLNIVDEAGNSMGYVVQTLTPTPGYGGEFEMYVGIDNNGKFTGMGVIGHSETQGLGTKTFDSAFWGQFVGNDASAEIVDYDSVSGATKSSVAFVSAVNNAISVYSQYLK